MRPYVSLDFKLSRSEPAFAQFASNVLNHVKGSSKLPTLQTVADTLLQPACEDYAAAIQAAADGSRTRIAEKRVCRQTLLSALETVARQLNAVPDLSEILILEAGFQPRRQKTLGVAAIGQVDHLKVRAGEQSGEAVVEFDRVPNAYGYHLEWSADGGEHWTNGTFSTSRRSVMNGLPVRQDVWVRAYALGSRQRKGAPSTSARIFLI